MAGKIWHQCGCEGGEGERHLWEDHTYKMVCTCSLIERGGPCEAVEGSEIGGYREPAYPAVYQSRCVAAGTCQGSCLGGH